MAIFESIRVALDAIWANKLRALLTMLGVIIGVSSVIIMIAIVQGARKSVVDQFEGNGSNLIFAFYDPKPDSVARGGFAGLDMDDINAIADKCSLVGGISPIASTNVEAEYQGQRKNVSLTGVLGTYTSTNNIAVDEGRFINDADDLQWSKACVIGQKIKSKLFGRSDPIGQEIHCSSNGSIVSLTVVGVLEAPVGPIGCIALKRQFQLLDAQARDDNPSGQQCEQVDGHLEPTDLCHFWCRGPLRVADPEPIDDGIGRERQQLQLESAVDVDGTSHVPGCDACDRIS